MNVLYEKRNTLSPQYKEIFILALLILINLIEVVSWVVEDTSPSTDPDANLYMIKTLQYINTLDAPSDFLKRWQAIEDLNVEGRPPLYQLISVPLVLSFGRSMDSGVYVNLLFSILLFVSVYNVGRIVLNGKAGLLSVVVLMGYPTLTSLAHNYRPYYAVAACVALNIWLLLLLHKRRSALISWLFGASLSFGFWLYPLYLWVAPIPSAILSFYIVFFQPRPKNLSVKNLFSFILKKTRESMVLFGFLPASIGSVGMVLAWYLTKTASHLIVVQKWVHSPWVAEFRGTDITTLGFTKVQPSFWWYAITAPNAISTVLLGLFILGLIIILVDRNFLSNVIVTFFVIGFIALSIQKGLGWRYFSMLLPVAAIITGVGISKINNKIFFSFLLLICLATSFINFSIVNHGVKPWNRAAGDFLGILHGEDAEICSEEPGWGYCARPPLREDWPVNLLLETVMNDPKCSQDTCSLMAIFQTSYMKFTVFSYYVQKDFPQSDLKILASGNPLMGMPLDFQSLLSSDYVVYESMPQPKGSTYDETLIRFLISPPSAFSDAHTLISEFTLPNGNVAKLLKRNYPLTLSEVTATLSAVEISEKHKIMQYLILAMFYEKEGDLSNAELYLQKGMEVELFQLIYEKQIKTIQEIINNKEILEESPNNFRAHTRLAKIYLENENCKKSIPHWEARLKSRIDYDTYTDLGEAYLKCKDWQKAIVVFQTAISFDARLPQARFGLAVSLAENGQKKEAIKEFRKLIKIAPNSEYADDAQKWLDELSN